MCSIVGLQGDFESKKIIELLKDNKNRGPDSSGVILDDNLFLDINLDDFDDDNNYSIALGHNLLSIFNLGSDSENYQPLVFEKLAIILNGEIYNFKSISNFLKKVSDVEEIQTDSVLILELIKYYLTKSGDILEAVKQSVKMLDGDYSFAIYDGDNLAIARDPLGVKPLFYSKTENLKGFSSTKYSLKNIGFKDIESLKPGSILYNWEVVEPETNIFEKKVALPQDVKRKLETLLKVAVLKRVTYLDEVAVIFSGGVDSAILTLLLKEISKNKDLKIKLYTVGKKNSKDVLAAKKLAEFFDLKIRVYEVTKEIIEENLPRVVELIGENNLMKIGVGMTIYLASKIIHEDGLKVAISGQGADELFAGYNRYLNSLDLDKELRYDIENMYHVNLERDDAVSMDNGVELRLPFLDKKLTEFALNIPASKKIKDSEDKLRKNILRDLAFELGLPEEFAYRPKKAAQYGTGIDKILRKKVLKEIDINSFL